MIKIEDRISLNQRVMSNVKTRPQDLVYLLLFLSSFALTVSTAAGSSIVGSKHDLSTSATPEVCVFCHTPHVPPVSLSNNLETRINAPLWNRFIGTSTPAFTVYASSTLKGTPTNPPDGISLACLGCHDGVLASGDKHDLLNAPGSGGVPDISSEPNCEKCHSFDGIYLNPVDNIGTDLTNDHPISISYPANDQAFNTPPDLQNGWSDVKLFNGKVECASCHDPHNPANGEFLRISNAGSALCYKCHNK